VQKAVKFIILILISSPLALLLAQCHFGDLLPVLMSKKIWLNDDENLVKQRIRQVIPDGSSIAEAKNVLQLNGFKCGYHKDSEPVDTIETTRTSKDADYLFCYLEISRVVCARTYKPFIYYNNEIVTHVDIKLGGWCL
jgi:hypothetical protein